MKKSERTIQEDFRLMKRGIREFRKILPGQMGLLAWKSVITAVTPYIAVVMSAMILNELAGDGDRFRLSAYILISTGATLLISMIGYRLEAKLAVGYDRLFSTHELILTDKAYRVPYHFLEDETVRSLREQVSGSISLTGGGMASLYWDMEVVVKNLCSGGIALILGQQFLWQVTAGVKGGMVSGREAAGMVLLLAALTVVCAYVTCRVSAGRFRVAFDVFVQGAKYNRYGDFYDLRYLPDEDMAMDIRIFRQKELILRESLEQITKDHSYVEELVALAGEHGFSRIPVVGEDGLDDILGILNVKDLLPLAVADRRKRFSVKAYVRPPYYVPESTKCRDLFATFNQQKNQIAVVVDEYGGTSGIVTMEDLLESIVGDIQDEYDNEAQEITAISQDRYTLDGDVDLTEVSRLLGCSFEERSDWEDYDTLGGLLIAMLDRIPSPGEHPAVELDGVRFAVQKSNSRQILEVLAERLPQEE